VLDAGVELQEAVGLGRQAVVEAGVGAHLHLQEHHRQLCGARLASQGPEHAIKPMAARFEFRRREAVLHIQLRGHGAAGHDAVRRYRQPTDQVRRRLEHPVEPAG
jgi:urease beta subunit